jgi:hypothetical protein
MTATPQRALFYQYSYLIAMSKYGKKAGEYVRKAVEKMKRGKLVSGRNRERVTNLQQAVAIGLAKARKAGVRVPRKRSQFAA